MWKETMIRSLSQRRTQLLLTGVIASAAGATAGYIFAAKKLETKYALLAASEIAEVKRHYALRNKDGVDLNKMASQYKDILEKNVYVNIHPSLEPVKDDGSDKAKRLIEEGQALAEKIAIAEEAVEKAKNIFDDASPADDNFDYEAEKIRREERPNEPYILTHDEYFENATDYNQVSLTFFEGDGVLIDEADDVCENQDALVGLENLAKFGYGSKDNNIVYIRNEHLSIDIEVLRSDGKYAKQVLGFDDGELEHSDKPKLRRFRDYDE